MPRTLDQWLTYQQSLHVRGIDMGLARVREVWQRMGAPRPAPIVITVGGTNGKGSTVAMIEAMLRAGGMRVGAYTSPHILRYNERVRVDAAEASDVALMAAFEQVEAARGDTTLTYFEFGTLAALHLFARAGLEVALLEVGLGGRLDAVNIIDADCAVVVTVDLDHMEYLGHDRESIGAEKAGIFRAGRPAIAGDPAPPASVIAHAAAIGAPLQVLERDFGWRPQLDASAWWQRDLAAPDHAHADTSALRVHEPLALAGAFQWRNAASAIAALRALGDRVRWNARAIEASGYAMATHPFLAGRLQRLATRPELVVDVGHNPQAARELAAWLDTSPVSGRTLAVYAALTDKDVEGVAAAIGARVDHWYLAGIAAESPRAEPVASLAARLRGALSGATCSLHDDIPAALAAACADAAPEDRILAFGSFHVVGPVLRMRRV